MLAFAIIARNDTNSQQLKSTMKDKLVAGGMVYNKISPQLVINIGGDGTYLYAVQKYMDQLDSVAFLGVHTGTLGFFTEYLASEVNECVEDILNKKQNISEASLLEIHLYQEKEEIVYALNEMRVENVLKTQILDISIDQEYFETFRGTGVCISTQAGSTAYNRSLGGAIIEDNLPLIQLSEITGIHHREFKSLGSPLILHESRKVTLASQNFNDAILCYDSLNKSLQGVSEIQCFASNKKVRFAHYRPSSYLEKLKHLF